MTNVQNYHVIYKSEPEGGYTVSVPTLPGCVTYGKSLDEAKTMAADAIAGYIESLKKHNEPVPSDNDSFISSMSVGFPGPVVYA